MALIKLLRFTREVTCRDWSLTLAFWLITCWNIQWNVELHSSYRHQQTFQWTMMIQSCFNFSNKLPWFHESHCSIRIYSTLRRIVLYVHVLVINVSTLKVNRKPEISYVGFALHATWAAQIAKVTREIPASGDGRKVDRIDTSNLFSNECW